MPKSQPTGYYDPKTGRFTPIRAQNQPVRAQNQPKKKHKINLFILAVFAVLFFVIFVLPFAGNKSDADDAAETEPARAAENDGSLTLYEVPDEPAALSEEPQTPEPVPEPVSEPVSEPIPEPALSAPDPEPDPEPVQTWTEEPAQTWQPEEENTWQPEPEPVQTWEPEPVQTWTEEPAQTWQPEQEYTWQPEPEPVQTWEPVAVVYVLNTHTLKIHASWCGDVEKIKPENYAETTDPQTYLSWGYTNCGHCGGCG